MTKEYTFSTTPGSTSCNPEDAPAPTTFADAVKFYQAVESWYGFSPIRVLELDHEEMTFKDVSEKIINELFEREDDRQREVMMDAAHERSETFGWEQV